MALYSYILISLFRYLSSIYPLNSGSIPVINRSKVDLGYATISEIMPKTKEILKKPVSVLIMASVLVFFSNFPAFFLLHKGLFDINSISFAVIEAISAFIIMFALPAIVIEFVFHQSLKDFGLCLPKNLPEAAKLASVTILIFLPVILFFGSQTSFQDYYAINQSFGGLFFLEIIASCIYFFTEEFLFRGFMFFGLWDKLGFNTFWLTSLVFALFHIGKPGPEIIFAFFAGLAFCYLSFKTRSFVPAVIVHLTLALILNAIVAFHFIIL